MPTKTAKTAKTAKTVAPERKEQRAVLALRAAVEIIVEYGARATLGEITIDNKELNLRLTRAGFPGSGSNNASKLFDNKYAREIVASRTGGRNLRITSIKNEFGLSRKEYRDKVIDPRQKQVKKVLEWDTAGLLQTSVASAVANQWHETGFAGGIGTMFNDIAEVKAEMIAE